MSDYGCTVCGTASLETLPQFSALPRVTSDCKPWPAGGDLTVCHACGTIQKLPSPRWFDEIERVYEDYEIYRLSDGEEQVIFSPDGTPIARSQILARHLAGTVVPQNAGRLLDIGCGNGSALLSFSTEFPGWSLSGSELSDKSLDRMRKIPGFETLHVLPTGSIPGRYDVVSMIHSLEHMPDPRQALADARRLLTSDGTLLVEVPDAETSPFDVLIVDHLTHLTRASLRHLVCRAGIRAIDVCNTVLPKENTLLGRGGVPAVEVLPDPAAGLALAHQTLAWLTSVWEAALHAAEAKSFGLFGSSISAVWLCGALDDQVDFFVDEDKTRIGRSLYGKPILAPADIPPGSTLFVPLAPQIAPRVAARLAHLPAKVLIPPSIH